MFDEQKIKEIEEAGFSVFEYENKLGFFESLD